MLSALAILLYVILFDVDPPELKPRQQLENVAAALLYTVSTVNIAVNLLALLTHLTGSHAL